MELKEALKILRTELGYTQTDLAQMLHVSFATVSRWENGRTMPNRLSCESILQMAVDQKASEYSMQALKAAMEPDAEHSLSGDLNQLDFALVNQMLNESANAVIVSDFETHEILYANAQAFRLVNGALEEAQGKKCYEYFMHKDCPCSFCNHCELNEEGFALREFSSPRSGRHFLMRGKLIIWKGRKAHLEYVTDETERYNRERKEQAMVPVLRARIETEKKRPHLGEKALISYSVVNLTQERILEHVYISNEETRAAENASMEQEKRDVENLIYRPEQRKAFHEMNRADRMIERYRSGLTEEEMDFQRIFPNGQVRWVKNMVHLLIDPETSDIYAFEYCYDIHEQKMQAEVLRAAVNYDYERLASINLENEQISMLYNSKERGHMMVNIEDYTQVSTEYGYREVVPEDKELFLDKISIASVRRELATAECYEFMHRAYRSDGTTGIKKTRFVMYDKENKMVLMTRSDVTDVVLEEKKKQQRLEKALTIAEEATIAKSEFLSRMSHEIRTPMNAIMGMTAIAKDNKSDYVQVSECLDKIDTSSQYLLTLLNDILEMSRIESGKIDIAEKEFNFFYLMNNVKLIAETLAKKSGVRYDYIPESEVETGYIGDAVRIQQVLINLISNAMKFTKAGGRVRFTVKLEKQTSERAHFIFVVEDTGIGMSKEFMKRMFQPFVQEDSGNTTMYSGSGLGLAISKNLVESMHGEISVESFQKVGSTFTVKLPLQRVQKVEQKVNENASKVNISQKEEADCLENAHVLLAEDHPLNVAVATKLLEKRGIIVTVANNGKAALEAFQESAVGDYDAILMDIRMPVMDGIDATIAIRTLAREDAGRIPIIAMTENALEEDREKTKQAGMNEHLAKPIMPQLMYSCLAEQITKYRRNR